MTVSRWPVWERGARWLVPLAALLVWQILYAGIGQPSLASPVATAGALSDNFAQWWPDVRVTLEALALSFAISAVVGVVGGIALGLSGFWYRVVSPLLLVVYALPKLVFYPIVLMALGLTLKARVTFAVLHGVFPILLLTATATTTVRPVHLQVARACRLSFLGRLRHIVLPSIVPSVVAALRIGFGSCFLGLIVAEMFAAYDGLGFRLSKYGDGTSASRLLAVTLLIVLVAFVVTYALYHWEERRALRLGGGMER